MAIVDKTHSQTIEEAFNSVVEGGSGGASVVVVNAIYEPDPVDSWKLDKTTGEIIELFDSGALIYLKRTGTEESGGYNIEHHNFCPMTGYVYGSAPGEEGSWTLYFAYPNDGWLGSFWIGLTEDSYPYYSAH